MSKKITDLVDIGTFLSPDDLLLVSEIAQGASRKLQAGQIVQLSTDVKITNYQAVRGDRVLYNPTGGTFTITAPLNPSDGDMFAIKNVSTSATGVTINGNGINIENPNTSTLVASYSLAAGLVALTYMYDSTNNQWVII